MTSESAEDEDERSAALLRQLRLARERPDRALHESILLAQLIAGQEKHVRDVVRWRTHTQQPSDADVDDMVQGVRIGIAKDIEKVLDGQVELGAVVGRKLSDEIAEFGRRRARRAREVSEQALSSVGVEDSPSLELEAVQLRSRLAALPERDRVFLAERFFGGLGPAEIARRHGVHRRVVDTATSRALKKLLGAAAPAEQRAVRNPGLPSGDAS